MHNITAENQPEQAELTKREQEKMALESTRAIESWEEKTRVPSERVFAFEQIRRIEPTKTY